MLNAMKITRHQHIRGRKKESNNKDNDTDISGEIMQILFLHLLTTTQAAILTDRSALFEDSQFRIDMIFT